MANDSSFQDLHRELKEAQDFLHAFARGYRGFTPNDGQAGVQRLARLCDQMETQFSGGAQAVAPILVSARAQIVEAKKRLSLLKG